MPIISKDDFVVIAAVDNREILAACLLRSPDVVSGALQVITIEGASSMAGAYNEALAKTDRTICVFVHQDVYLPKGWLDIAVKRLDILSYMDPLWQVAGPDGLTGDRKHYSHIWDVTLNRHIGPSGFPPMPIVSLDELMLIVRRDADFRFDDALPHFHLYGTDVVQSAWAAGRSAYVIELPVVHNNRPIASLGGGYQKAYNYARRKWRAELPIKTTASVISYNPYHLWRAQWMRRHVKERPPGLLVDSVEAARTAGYE